MSRFSRPAETAALSALILGVVLAATPLTAALAAPSEARQAAGRTQTAAAAAAATVDVTGSVAAKPAGEEPNCQKARRKMFVEGEGWIVRRVTTCH
jgi:hypothetical protein